ncbi:MAG: alkaline phosphatase, partial [Thermoguttaceae bacterium]
MSPNRVPGDRRLCFEQLESRRLLSVGPPAGSAPMPPVVILMIGDGMGTQHVEAGRMFLGGEIAFDRLPYQAEMTTFSANASVTDSAASGTAMATGRKVDNGVISRALPGDGADLTTALEIHQSFGKATGLVTTSTVTHATPAAFGAHAASRNDTTEIASDLLTQTRPNVLFGGGASGMTVDAAVEAGYTVVQNRTELAALNTQTETFVSGQFGAGHLPYEYDGLGNLPHLSEMTTVALDILDNDPDGFFLMIEAGRIDHAGHANDIERNVRETAQFSETVEVVLDWAAGRTDTLVIVTADHETGGLTVLEDNGPGIAPDATWSTGGHTAADVPVYAYGSGAESVGSVFDGVLDNTDIFELTTGVNVLGPIDSIDLGRVDPSAGDLWYRGRATHEGWLSIQARPQGPGGDAAVVLYDGQLNRLAASTSGPVGERIDWPAEVGATYFFQITGSSTQVDTQFVNLVEVSPDGTRATVQGTEQNDRFSASAGPQWSAEVNGIAYELAAGAEVTFFGGGGSDSAVFLGSAGNDLITLAPDHGTVTGLDFRFEFNDVATVEVQGRGGNDTVRLFDSPGNDTLIAAPNYGKLSGEGFSLRASQVAQVEAYATAGGVDVAKLYDSPGNDTFEATPGLARLDGPTYSIRVDGFDAVHAYGTSGGTDTANLYDSAGDDRLYASPYEAALYGSGFYNRAKSFEDVTAYATAGGFDQAEFVDSPGNDQFVATPTYAHLKAAGYLNRARSFDRVTARATAGGLDVAKLYDSPGNDQFVAAPNYGRLKGTDFYNRAEGFDGTHAYATAGGIDVAKFFDSPGDDTFYADPTVGALYGDGFYNRAKFFEGVHAYATAAGHDVARLYDSPGDDTFYADPINGALYGAGFYNRAKYFEEVYARADNPGHDVAELHDSPSVDLIEAEGAWARLSNAAVDFLYEVSGFDRVKATATTLGDTQRIALHSPLLFDLELEGPWRD